MATLRPLLAAALLATLVLSACGRPSAPPSSGSAPTGPVRVTSANFSDADPVDWPGRAPESYPVHGIDLSRWQDGIDWPTARAAGVNFAFIKATEGGDILDPAFARHWADAGNAGVLRGAYHFFYFCTSARTQARWFIANVPRTPGALPPVLDVEWNPHSPTCTTRPDPATVRSEVGIFMDIVGRHYGQRPIVYAPIEFWRDNGFDDITNEEFWLRSTADHPSETYDGAPWVFWQYSGTGLVPGIPGRVDLNSFAGSAASWRNWVAARRQ